MTESLLHKEVAQLWMEVARLHEGIAALKTQIGEQLLPIEGAAMTDAQAWDLYVTAQEAIPFKSQANRDFGIALVREILKRGSSGEPAAWLIEANHLAHKTGYAKRWVTFDQPHPRTEWDVTALYPASAQPRPSGGTAPDARLYTLARAALRMAYTWNDHNFPAPEVWLREKCAELGINSLEEANTFLSEHSQINQVPADSELVAWMEEAVEYVNVPTRSPSLEEEGRKLLRRAGKEAHE